MLGSSWLFKMIELFFFLILVFGCVFSFISCLVGAVICVICTIVHSRFDILSLSLSLSLFLASGRSSFCLKTAPSKCSTVCIMKIPALRRDSARFSGTSVVSGLQFLANVVALRCWLGLSITFVDAVNVSDSRQNAERYKVCDTVEKRVDPKFPRAQW